jgi:hypothetical protein
MVEVEAGKDTRGIAEAGRRAERVEVVAVAAGVDVSFFAVLVGGGIVMGTEEGIGYAERHGSVVED